MAALLTPEESPHRLDDSGGHEAEAASLTSMTLTIRSESFHDEIQNGEKEFGTRVGDEHRWVVPRAQRVAHILKWASEAAERADHVIIKRENCAPLLPRCASAPGASLACPHIWVADPPLGTRPDPAPQLTRGRGAFLIRRRLR